MTASTKTPFIAFFLSFFDSAGVAELVNDVLQSSSVIPCANGDCGEREEEGASCGVFGFGNPNTADLGWKAPLNSSAPSFRLLGDFFDWLAADAMYEEFRAITSDFSFTGSVTDSSSEVESSSSCSVRSSFVRGLSGIARAAQFRSQ